MRKRNVLLLLAVLVLLTAVPQVQAAQTGSIAVVGVQEPVSLYHVAAADGSLTEAFSGSGVDITDADQAIANAGILWRYADEQNVPGQTRTPDGDGTVKYAPLEEGLYLIGSAARPAEFDPFLVKIPTEINGEPIYDIQAQPKQEDDDPPGGGDDPPGGGDDPPGGGDDPPGGGDDIPQTGDSVIPKYLLMIVGSAVTLAGLYLVLTGKEESHE